MNETDYLTTAVAAHERGWTPVPLRPRDKVPLVHDYPHLDWQSADEVRAAFAELAVEEDPNVGLALGPDHGGLVDIDIDHPKAALIAAQLLPSTDMRSGRPTNAGSHFWYRVTDHDPGTRRYMIPTMGTIVEYRGRGGQTVAPGSIHPTGEVYAWEGDPWGGAEGPAAVPGEQLHAHVILIAVIVALSDAWPARGGRHDAYLALAGALLRDAADDGTPRIHPLWESAVEPVISLLAELTNDTDGAATRVAETVPSTKKRILADQKVQGWPTLADLLGESHTRKIREWVEEAEAIAGAPRGKLRRAVDTSQDTRGLTETAAGTKPGTTTPPDADDASGAESESWEARTERLALKPLEERNPLAERASSWEVIDLAPYLLGGVEPEAPSVLVRSDGAGLLYPGRVNSLYGAGGSGKTLLALSMVASEYLNAGRRVMMIDFEDEPTNTLSRLRDLGASDQALLDGLFAYVAPESGHAALQRDAWGNSRPSEAGMANARAMAEAVTRTRPELVLIDGVTTLYAIHGLNSNDAGATDVIGQWLRKLTANNSRTVLMIDHTPKASGPGVMPIGSQHKISMIQGSALQVFTTKKPRRGQTGEASLYIGKDRLGRVSDHAEGEDPERCGVVTFDSSPDGKLSITIDPPPPADTVVSVDVSGVPASTQVKQSPADSAPARQKPATSSPAVGRPALDRAPQYAAILRALTAAGAQGMRRKDLVTAVNLSDTATGYRLTELAAEGKVKKVGAGPTTRWVAK